MHGDDLDTVPRMSIRKVVGQLLVLGGSLAVGYAISGVVAVGNCTTKVCSDSTARHQVMLFVGIFAIVGGIWLLREFAFLLPLLVAAAGAVLARLDTPPQGRDNTLIVAGAFVVAYLVLRVVGWVAHWREQRRDRRRDRLLTTGGKAIGTVIAVEGTGVRVGRTPQLRFLLRIEPIDGTPSFEGTRTAVVVGVETGQRYPVWYDNADHADFIVGVAPWEGASPEVLALFAIAQKDQISPQGMDDPLTQMERLDALRRSGALTSAEFDAMKARILAGPGAQRSGSTDAEMSG
jgi:hypothetical protein